METYSTKYISVHFCMGESGWMWLTCEAAGWVRAFLVHKACRGFSLFFFYFRKHLATTRLESWGIYVFCRNAREAVCETSFPWGQSKYKRRNMFCHMFSTTLLPFTFPTEISLVRTGKYFVHKDRKFVINWFLV